MSVWQVNEAKAHLSELIDRACQEGPQTITRHGAERAVILSTADYHRLVADRPDFRPDFKNWLFGGPKLDDFDIERSPDTGRDIAL